MTPSELGWLAVLLEGEGTFTFRRAGENRYRCALVTLSMIDRDVIQRAAGLMGVGTVSYRHPPSHRAKGWKPQYRASLNGQRAERLMIRLLPFLGERRYEQSCVRTGRVCGLPRTTQGEVPTMTTDHFTEARAHAAVLAEYRDALLAEGFTDHQTIRLLVTLQESLLMGRATITFFGDEGDSNV